MHNSAAKAYFVHNYNGVELSEDTNTPSYLKRSSHGDAANDRLYDTLKNPHLSSFQDRNHFPRDAFEDEEDVSEHVERAHVLAPPVTIYDKTSSSKLNDNVGRKGFDFSYTNHGPKPSIRSDPRYYPELTMVSKSNNLEQSKEAVKELNEKIMVDVDFLHKLESKISDLQSRVEECEGARGAPDSASNSSISDSEDSVDSVSDLGHRGGRAAKYARDFDHDEIIICEPEVKKCQQGAKLFRGPNLKIVRWNYLGENQRYEAVRDGMPTRPVVEFPFDRPLLTVISEYDCHIQFWRRRVEIASPPFFDLLKEVSQHNMSDVALHEGVFYLMEPLMGLFLNRKQLTDYVESTDESTEAKEHAEFILNFLKSDFGDISRVLDNFESVTPPNLVKYCDLWMLYRPGTTVYSHANGEWEAFVVDDLDGMQIRKPSQNNRHALTRLDLRAWSMNFDGEVYGRVWSIHCVAPFHGVRDIGSLALVPEKFLLDGNTIKESLLSRGKKFCQFQVQYCQESETSPSQSTRVMVDHLTYQRRNGWLISIDGKYGPSSAKDGSWNDNKYSDWDTSGEVFDRRPRRYIPQRSLVRHFESEYCSRDYELESIDKPEDTQAEPCRRYSADRPSRVVVREFEKYDLIRTDAETDELTLMLFPQHVRGFCFRDKVWSKFIHCPAYCGV